MRNIYTSIDMGCDSVKIVVAELFEDNFYVLASTSKRCLYLKLGTTQRYQKAHVYAYHSKKHHTSHYL